MANNVPDGVSPELYAAIKKAYGVKGHMSNLDKRRATDIAQRLISTKILQPEDIQGDYDVNRMLNTTLGGKKRTMTTQDLIAFKRNIATAKTRYVGGITPQQVINLALDADIDRSRQQIKTAVLSRRTAKGECFIVTNASAESEHRHHTVHLKFYQFTDAIVSAGKTPDLVKHFMSNGKIGFDCTCERHRYWFRYITTIGGFNAGRPETGFPKIRNPNLMGVACKHVILVMHRIQQPAMRVAFEQWLKGARASQDTQTVQATAAEMKAEAIRQAQKSHHKRNLPARREQQMIVDALRNTNIVPKGYKDAIDSLDKLRNASFINEKAYKEGVAKIRKQYGVK